MKIHTKLNNQHGVSILFALMMMLVAAMVSLTIVSASISAVKRTNAIRNTQQESLSLDSATLFIKKQMNEGNQFELYYDDNRVQETTSCGYFNEDIQSITSAFINGNYRDYMNLFTIETGTDSEIYDDVDVLYKLKQGNDENECVCIFLLKTENSKQYLKYTLSKTNENVYWTFYEASGKE